MLSQASMLSAAGRVALPQIVPSRLVNDVFPIWVSAQAMTRTDGSVDWTLVHSPPPHALLDWSKTTDCSTAGRLTFARPPGYWEPSDIPDLIRRSSGVCEGRIASSEPGLFRSMPGFLLEVEVAAWLDAHALERLDRLYVFYPGGSFRLGPYRVCVNDGLLHNPPAIGDRLLVALTPGTGPDDDFGVIFAPHHKAIFIGRPDGALDFSPEWRGSPDVTGDTGFEDLRDRLRRTIQERPRR
jgi:hypothetical protein